MKSVCVFCGSNVGINPIFKCAAQELGEILAEENIRLVYGGGSIGLMGVLADAVLGNGGEVVGIIPQFLYDKEVGHDGNTELIIVNSMHERKQKMAELSDGFIAMPGGIGTMEELFEIFTWSQLDLIKKPVSLYNVNHFYDELLLFFNKMVEEGFIMKNTLDTLIKGPNIHEIIEKMKGYNSTETLKQIKKT
ncbi:UNVERIFIED_CONTAM: hypothetical protein GTU68_045933 [Idotea baltica]|nr:hypothetical protein [Idotea baltica]